MNFFERKERYKSGQNPTPTQEEFEKQMVKVGDKWWPRATVSRRDIYYGKPEQPQTPPIPPNARSFGNERPPLWMRKPPMNKGVSEMSTKIIVDKRRTGKTTQAILESSRTGLPIIVNSRDVADYILKIAKDLNWDIPQPIALVDWMRRPELEKKYRDGVILDEGLVMLERLMGTRIHMITMSERDEAEA